MFSSNKKIGYYSLLGFDKEPFSTSPNPEFFFPSRQHELVLTNLLIELRLRRGLSVVFGDVGTGKTTLSRKLLHELNKRKDMVFHMILNPSFVDEAQFLGSLVRNFDISCSCMESGHSQDVVALRDSIERFLIQKTLEEHKTVVLVIDEAQKLDLSILEALRVLLNFETNEHKLIQLILLGQLELYSKVVTISNFMDRISFKFMLNPLDMEETKELIEFRISRAGYHGYNKIFLDEAIEEIFNHSGGYPRKINMLCHKVLTELVMNDARIADRILVQEVITRDKKWSIPQQIGEFKDSVCV